MDEEQIEVTITKIFEKPQTIATLNELRQQAKSAYVAFCNADEDHSLCLSVNEILNLCEAMGLKADQNEEETLSKMDADGSYSVDLNEWLTWWLTRVSKLANPIKQQEIIAMKTFEKFDANASNTIDATEFRNLVEELGADFTDEEIQEVVSLLDVDQSGSIDRDEFLAWWTQRSANLRYGSSAIAVKLRKLATRATQRFSTDMFTAVWEGDDELVKAFLDGDANAVLSSDGDNNDWTAMHYAAYRGHVSLIRLLLLYDSKGVNRTTCQGFTAVFYAAQQGHVSAVRVLMEAGADPTLWGEEDDLWMSPLEHCIDTPALADIFLEHPKCTIPSLAEISKISASMTRNTGSISVGLPSSKSIGVFPISSWEIQVFYVEENRVQTQEYIIKASKPSEKQTAVIAVSKKLIDLFLRCVDDGTLKLSVAAMDPVGRKGEAYVMINIV